jgi:hypothetical protein
LAALPGGWSGSGAQTGSLTGPTVTMIDALNAVKADLAAIEKEMK